MQARVIQVNICLARRVLFLSQVVNNILRISQKREDFAAPQFCLNLSPQKLEPFKCTPFKEHLPKLFFIRLTYSSLKRFILIL